MTLQLILSHNMFIACGIVSNFYYVQMKILRLLFIVLSLLLLLYMCVHTNYYTDNNLGPLVPTGIRTPADMLLAGRMLYDHGMFVKV